MSDLPLEGNEDEPALTFDAFSGLAREGAMPVWGFALLVQLDQDGVEQVDFSWVGDRVRAYTAVGAMEAAKLELFMEHWERHPR